MKVPERFWPYALLYALLVAACIPWYQYQIHADGISYLNIANHWLNGRLYQAVNGYWSPLVSWVLAPFLAAGIPGPLAGKLVGGLGGLLALFGLWRLAGVYGLAGWARGALLLGASGFLLHSALFALTPDVWSAGFILLIWAELFSPKFKTTIPTLFRVGALGALAYFAKNYNLIYLSALLLAISVFILIKKDFKQLKIYLLALGVMWGFVSPWVVALGMKYGHHPTISTAGQYNIQLMTHHNNVQAFERLGFIEVPIWGISNAWEDITAGIEVHEEMLRMENTPPTRTHLEVFGHNTWVLGHFLVYRGLFLLLPFVLLLVFQSIKNRKWLSSEVSLAGAAGIYVLGYLLVLFEDRYVWPAYLGLAVLAMVYFTQLKNRRLRHFGIGLVACVLAGWSLFTVVRFRNDNLREHLIAESFRNQGLDLRSEAVAAWPGHWHFGMELCYRMGADFKGQPNFSQDLIPIEEQIRRLGMQVGFIVLEVDTVPELRRLSLKRWEADGAVVYQLGS